MTTARDFLRFRIMPGGQVHMDAPEEVMDKQPPWSLYAPYADEEASESLPGPPPTPPPSPPSPPPSPPPRPPP